MLGSRQILEAVLSQVEDHDLAREIAGEVAGRLRDEDLATVRRCADPRRTVDVEPHETGRAAHRLAGVEAHPDSDREGPVVPSERLLALDGREQGLASPRECVEEAVA